MKTIPSIWLLVFAACSLSIAQLCESDRKLDLKSIHFFTARATGTRLFLSVTGQPPDIFLLTNLVPTPLKHGQATDTRTKVQIVLGKDIIGFAEVTEISRGFVPSAQRAPKLQFSSMALTFETAEQAVRAVEAVGLSDATPKPLQKSKQNH